MSEIALPTNVLALLRDRIGSFEELEALMLLFQEQDESWTSRAVARRLGTGVDLIEQALESLHRAHLVQRVARGDEVRYQHGSESEELAKAVADLAEECGKRRVDVFRAMSANTVRRQRDSAIHMFADAFVLRRRKKDG